MKKIFIITMMISLLFTGLFPLQSKVQAEEILSDRIEIPEEVLNSVPAEIKVLLESKTITKKQYELFLELAEKESRPSNDIDNEGISPLASNVNPGNCQYDLGSSYCFRIDPANTSTKEPYHIHIYKKKVHQYCMRLDNFKECDASKNQVHKFDDLPTVVKEGIMKHNKVQERVKIYNPDASKWANAIPFIKTLAISVIVVALVVTPIPGDEYVAWAYFLKAI
ncbi:hypothetical protein [Psychrobacillus psychrotolerans]|uniref:hypothetical protein n=1 Tax=Psychrobacillus psychrotolerans TaxID=126156 RepID=UPI0033152001